MTGVRVLGRRVGLGAFASLWACGPLLVPAASGAPTAHATGGGLELVTRCHPEPVEICLNARDDDCNGVADEGCGLPPGALSFALSWLGPADLDLEVVGPGGELAQVGYPVGSGLEKLADCPGEACGETHYEYVYLPEPRRPVHGTYRVRVVLRSPGLWGQGARASLAVSTLERTRQYRARVLTEGEAQGVELSVGLSPP